MLRSERTKNGGIRIGTRERSTLGFGRHSKAGARDHPLRRINKAPDFSLCVGRRRTPMVEEAIIGATRGDHAHDAVLFFGRHQE